MEIRPTIVLTERDKATLGEARERARGGLKLQAKHEAAVAKQRLLTEQQSFVAIGSAVPREMLLQILGSNRDQSLRELGERVGERLGKTIDLFAVVRRLAAAGPATAAAGRETARTYGELADKLGLKSGDPERTLKQYHARGMPGRPGSRGKQNGEFDVELCRAWLALNVRTEGGVTNEELQDSRRRIAKLDLQRKENELLEQLGRLADVNQVAAYVTSCVANCRAVLDGLPDEILESLPAGTPDVVRLSIHQVCQQVIDTACEEMARASHDDDLGDEAAEGPG